MDTATATPARVMKLYGTMAIKGTHTLERPHRFSSVDLRIIPKDVDLFARLAAELAEGRGLSPARRSWPAQGAAALAPTPAPVTESVISVPEQPTRASIPDLYREWRQEALRSLSLERVYGQWLTGKRSGGGWLECRDPDSETGDRNPSASIADGRTRPSVVACWNC